MYLTITTLTLIVLSFAVLWFNIDKVEKKLEDILIKLINGNKGDE